MACNEAPYYVIYLLDLPDKGNVGSTPKQGGDGSHACYQDVPWIYEACWRSCFSHPTPPGERARSVLIKLHIIKLHEITMNYTRTRTESMHRYAGIMRPKTADPVSSLKRPTPRPRAQTHENVAPVEEPWKHMADTYTWVVEQEYVKLEQKNRKTEKWVIEQQGIFADNSNKMKEPSRPEKPKRRRTWDELENGRALEADMWVEEEVAVRRAAIEREKEKAKMIEDDIRRIQARVQQKKENEKRRLAEERGRATEAHKEKERQDRAKSDVASKAVWRSYEDRWDTILASSGPLTFHVIPWPLVSHPLSTKDILHNGIMAFLLSPLHSGEQSRKDRIRTALLRWHPDRFQKILARVVDEDVDEVEDGVGIVARCLNELMERETRASRRKFD